MHSQRVRTIVFFDDRLNVLCSVAAQDDTFGYWHGAWLTLARQVEGRSQIDQLLAFAPDLPICAVNPDDSGTFFLVLYALVEALQGSPDFEVDQWRAGTRELQRFLDSRFFFGRPRGRNPGDMLVRIDGQVSLPLQLPDRRAGLACIEVEEWLGALANQEGESAASDQLAGRDFIASAIRHHEYLYRSARLQRWAEEQDSDWVMLSFVTFCRALAERLERDDKYQPYRRRLGSLLEIIVSHEPDLDVARGNLLQLLRSPDPGTEKTKRLERLVNNLAKVEDGTRQTDGAAMVRAATLTSLIADHYLGKYDLNSATGIWRWLASQDRWLASILRLFESSGWLLACHAFVFLLLTGLALSRAAGGLSGGRQWLALSLLLFLLLMPTWFAIGLARGAQIRGLYYGQLFLPRMLGAIFVGLAALLLDDLPWKVTLIMPGPILLLLAAGVYLMSYLYILLDVHQAIRFEAWPARDSSVSRKNDPATRAIHGSTLSRAAGIALRIHSIGVLQSFLLTLLVTGLMLPLIFREAMAVGSAPWEQSFLGWIALSSGVRSDPVFVFAPALVLLWTGLALFVGAFVQLLWQEHRVTSPVRE